MSEAPDTWQPIDTAPRDGTEILCAERITGGEWVLSICRWESSGPGWDGCGYDLTTGRPKPTLWKPLIPPDQT